MAYKQARARRKKLLKTYNETKNSYGSGVAFDENRKFYYKYTASNTPGYAKSLRKISNKKLRRTPDIGSYGCYRKNYDYNWELF
jgi:hypothetical protein